MDSTGLLALAGALVGLVMALTGAGGGVLAVPLLVLGLGVGIHQAAPVSLLAVGVASATGALLGWREGVLRYRAALLMGVLGLVCAPVGVWLAQRLPATPLLLGFACVLLLTARRMARREPSRGQAPCEDDEAELPCRVQPVGGRLRWTAPCARQLALTGALAGLLSGLLGVGGGFVIVPALTRVTNLDTRSIATTSLAVIALISVGGLASASSLGRLDLGLALPFGAGATGALLLGRQVAGQLPSRTLRRAFAGVCVLVALLLLARALGWVGL